MNKTYRIVWNKARGNWTAASERARCNGASASAIVNANITTVSAVRGCPARAPLRAATAGALCAFALANPWTAQAATSWNVSSGDWTTAGNWTSGVPTSTTQTIIGNGGAATLGVSSPVTDGTGQLIVGNRANGILVERNGSKLTSTSTTLGNASGVTGGMSVIGSGTSFTTSGGLTVGNSGPGTLTISSGAAATSSSATILGNVSGSTGAITVTGSGSKLADSAGFMYVGNAGTGALTANNSDSVTTASNLYVGNTGTGVGTLTIGSGGSFSFGGAVILGNSTGSKRVWQQSMAQ
ncbi:ESPR domain-containing protein, partial [Burkholderia pyrrocinia]|uniref:ESPR domain-containing protein n=1 Tax=Burkholderia pyrrocinia TaxID=60550 RepID=UPI002445C1C5